jgi:hypothetical protein
MTYLRQLEIVAMNTDKKMSRLALGGAYYEKFQKDVCYICVLKFIRFFFFYVL